MGIYTDKPLFVKSCPRHYGIKVRSRYASYENHLRRDVVVDAEGVEWALDQIRWFVPKGDGLFPGKSIHATHDCSFSMKASEYRRAQGKRSQRMGGQNAATMEVVMIASSRDQPPIRLDAIDPGEGPTRLSPLISLC